MFSEQSSTFAARKKRTKPLCSYVCDNKKVMTNRMLRGKNEKSSVVLKAKIVSVLGVWQLTLRYIMSTFSAAFLKLNMFYKNGTHRYMLYNGRKMEQHRSECTLN